MSGLFCAHEVRLPGRHPLRRALQRAVPLGFTLALHLAAGLLLTMPGAPGRRPRPPGIATGDALRLRWITRAPVAPSVPPRARRKSPSPSRAIERTHGRRRPPERHAAEAPQTAQPDGRSLDLSLDSAPAEPDYIPGGHGLRVTRGSVPRLPGRASVPHAPVFQMSDPRTQGVAGWVRAIHAFAGGADPRCLQLAQWRALTLRERAAQGIGGDDMARVEREHGCRPDAPRGGPGANPLRTPPPGR